MCPYERNQRSEVAGASEIPSAFEVLDKDCDGKISSGDLRAFYESLDGASNASEGEIGWMISVADSNRDGYVELEELETVLGCGRDASPEREVLREAFEIMDGDGDGKVGFVDLKGFLARAGMRVSDQDVWTMIEMEGGNGAGVSFDAFLKILAVDLCNSRE